MYWIIMKDTFYNNIIFYLEHLYRKHRILTIVQLCICLPVLPDVRRPLDNYNKNTTILLKWKLCFCD